MYYNTTNITNPTLLKEWKNSEKQELRIKYLMAVNKDKDLTGDRIWYLYWVEYEGYTGSWSDFIELHKRTPLTSIRRACDSLIKDNELMQTRHKKKSVYGKPAHILKLANN